MYETCSELGGTWSRNTYPDARVDTSSFTYQFAFEQNYPWSEYFARQPEVREYLEHVAKKYGGFDRIRFDTQVTSAAYETAADEWRLVIRDPDGVEEIVAANFVVSASGLFNLANRSDMQLLSRIAEERARSSSSSARRNGSRRGRSTANRSPQMRWLFDTMAHYWN